MVIEYVDWTYYYYDFVTKHSPLSLSLFQCTSPRWPDLKLMQWKKNNWTQTKAKKNNNEHRQRDTSSMPIRIQIQRGNIICEQWKTNPKYFNLHQNDKTMYQQNNKQKIFCMLIIIVYIEKYVVLCVLTKKGSVHV